MRSIGNITRDFPFNWIVFASVSYNLRASHSPIVLKIRTRNFSLAATGIITETRVPLLPSRSQLAALFFISKNNAPKSVEFSFNNHMYKQIDGVAMSSPLSVALANIFVGYRESKLFEATTKPFLYHQYVDDTFAIFGSEDECTSFLDALNSMHSALKFTFEKEENDQLPFLDVLVEKSNERFLTSVFRKPTFTGQHFRWDLFGPARRKTNLIETLVHRA